MDISSKINGVRRRKPDLVVGFRVDLETFERLSSRAALLGISTHKLARAYLADALFEPEMRQALEQTAIATQFELKSLRSDLALAVKALLVSAGKTDLNQAEKWVGEKLNQ
jgi:hypothetical protein